MGLLNRLLSFGQKAEHISTEVAPLFERSKVLENIAESRGVREIRQGQNLISKYKEAYSPKEASIFHGTSHPWEGHQPGSIERGLSKGNLYGPGLYTTSSPTLAAEYMKRGAEEAPRGMVYGLAPREPLNLINLDKPLSSDVMKVFQQTPGLRVTPKALKFDMPGHEVYHAVREANYSDKPLLDLARNLRSQGYHGFTHEGGGIVGDVPHQVSILFDPEHDVDVLSKDPFRSSPQDIRARVQQNIAVSQDIRSSRTSDRTMRTAAAHKEVLSNLVYGRR